MKTVIFICLLSLTVCLSDQSLPQDGKPTLQDSANKIATDPNAQISGSQSALKISTEALSVPAQAVDVTSTLSSPPEQNTPSNGNIPPQANSNPATPLAGIDKPNKTNADNKTDSKLPETKETEAKPTDEKIVPTNASNNETSTETTGKTQTNSTIIDNKEKKDMNMTKNDITKATEAPPLQSRSFDGPSFIGGIILTLGLIAISFMGYKYYKNQTERNYYGTL